jgi:uncharacterized protein (TIGR02300 family)
LAELHLNRRPRVTIIESVSSNKAARGVKRVCRSCGARFYDLAREPIVCPLCRAEYALVAEPVVAARTRAAAFTSKTGWRGRGVQRAKPVLPVHAPEARAAETPEDTTEPVLDVVPQDNVVLEQELDDGADVAELGVDGLDTKES